MLLYVKLAFVILSALVALTGCSVHPLKGSHYSHLDPDNQIDKNTPILVAVIKDDLNSKYYLKYVVDKLKENGFTQVSSDSNNPPSDLKYMVFVSVFEKIDSYQYASPVYGSVNSGTSNINCSSYNGYTNCTSTNNKTSGVTGYAQNTGYTHGYYFKTQWFGMTNHQKTFDTLTATHEKNCNSDKLYKFLIDESIPRLNFQKPLEIDFEVTMPENYRCDIP